MVQSYIEIKDVLAAALADHELSKFITLEPALQELAPTLPYDRTYEGPQSGNIFQRLQTVKHSRPGQYVIRFDLWRDGWAKILSNYHKVDRHSPESITARLLEVPLNLINQLDVLLQMSTHSSEYGKIIMEKYATEMAVLSQRPIECYHHGMNDFITVWIVMRSGIMDDIGRRKQLGRGSPNSNYPDIYSVIAHDNIDKVRIQPRLSMIRNGTSEYEAVCGWIKACKENNRRDKATYRKILKDLGFSLENISTLWKVPYLRRQLPLTHPPDLLHLWPKGAIQTVLEVLPLILDKKFAVLMNQSLKNLSSSKAFLYAHSDYRAIGNIFVNMDTARPTLRSLRSVDILVIVEFFDVIFESFINAEEYADLKAWFLLSRVFQFHLHKSSYVGNADLLVLNQVRYDWVHFTKTFVGDTLSLNRPNIACRTYISTSHSTWYENH